MRVKTNDGATFAGRSPKQIVGAMMREQWNAPEGKMEYMDEVATRVEQMAGADGIVRRDSAEAFLSDLARLGLVTVEHEG